MPVDLGVYLNFDFGAKHLTKTEGIRMSGANWFVQHVHSNPATVHSMWEREVHLWIHGEGTTSNMSIQY